MDQTELPNVIIPVVNEIVRRISKDNNNPPPEDSNTQIERKTKCKKYNMPIAHYEDDSGKRIVYYTECKCKDAEDKFSELRIEPPAIFTPIPFQSANRSNINFSILWRW